MVTDLVRLGILPDSGTEWLNFVIAVFTIAALGYSVPNNARYRRLKSDLDNADASIARRDVEIADLKSDIEEIKEDLAATRAENEDLKHRNMRLSADLELVRSALGAEKLVQDMEKRMDAKHAARHEELMNGLSQITAAVLTSAPLRRPPDVGQDAADLD